MSYYFGGLVEALKILKAQADKDIAAEGEVGSGEMQELEALYGWRLTEHADALLHLIASWEAAQNDGTDAPPKVLIAYWHDTVGAHPSDEIYVTDGDLDGLVNAVSDIWLLGTSLRSWEINDIRHNLLFGRAADIPTPPDAIATLSQITIEEYAADNPDIQWVFEED